MKRGLVLFVAIVGAGILGSAHPAHATVDAWFAVATPVQAMQTEGVCFRDHTMHAAFGIPMMSVAKALTMPALVYVDDAPAYEDMNAITTGLDTFPIVTYLNDSFQEATGVWSFDIKVNLGAVARANGTSVAGRTDTIRRGKLLLLALVQNFHRVANGKYRLRVVFEGLPTQTGLPGTPLYATTQSPYSSTSRYLSAYRSELAVGAAGC